MSWSSIYSPSFSSLLAFFFSFFSTLIFDQSKSSPLPSHYFLCRSPELSSVLVTVLTGCSTIIQKRFLFQQTRSKSTLSALVTRHIAYITHSAKQQQHLLRLRPCMSNPSQPPWPFQSLSRTLASMTHNNCTCFIYNSTAPIPSYFSTDPSLGSSTTHLSHYPASWPLPTSCGSTMSFIFHPMSCHVSIPYHHISLPVVVSADPIFWLNDVVHPFTPFNLICSLSCPLAINILTIHYSSGLLGLK